METQLNRPINKWWLAISIVLALYVVASIGSLFLRDTTIIGGNKIVVIPISGTITMDRTPSSFIEFETTAADAIIEKITDAAKNSNVKAVLFEINSPGGSAVASKEIADAVKHLNKTNYAVIREVGASGAYWIAAATNKIIAQDASITGSVGVLSSYLQFSGFLKDHNITYERLTAGKYKDLGTPFKDLTSEERRLLEHKLGRIHADFLSDIQKRRNLAPAQLARVQTGEFFLGSEALELGLIDAIGSKQDALAMLKKALKQDDIAVVEEKPRQSLLSYFTETGAYHFGRGIGSVLVQRAEHTPATATPTL